MQPQDFLTTINGQAVDSFLWFFFLFCPPSQFNGGQSVGRNCVSLTQNGGDVGARCMQSSLQPHVGRLHNKEREKKKENKENKTQWA